MEPRIQYAKTADGVSIAYYAMGEGLPLIVASQGLWSHLRIQHVPEYARSGKGIGRDCRIIRYDARGTGLSDRSAIDFSLHARLRDIQAVVDRLELDRFALFGGFHGGPAAIAYAANHADSLTHLVLFNTYCHGADFASRPRARALDSYRDTADDEWEHFTLTAASLALEFTDSKRAERLAMLYRESMTPDSMRAHFSSLKELDVSTLLPRVAVPTLVLYRSNVVDTPVHWSRELASKISGALLVTTRGERGQYWGDAETSAVEEFLGTSEGATASRVAPSGLVTILFTDVEGSTALTQRLGDARAQELLRTHNTIVRDALKAQSGSEVKHTGDGIMASFPSASQAPQCAISIQQGVVAQADMPLRVRIGLNAGEPVAEEKDLFGTAVQLARRVCDHAEPGQILASNVVRELAMGKGFLFSDHGDVELRGFEDPVRLYEVSWQENG
jgi:class 3 adenylate cyclase